MVPPKTRSLLSIFLTFAIVAIANGQNSDGKITGSVKDNDGALLSGVSVSLQLANQAVTRAVVTDAEGKFTLANIRSEEHTSELQSQSNLVCRLLLEKK